MAITRPRIGLRDVVYAIVDETTNVSGGTLTFGAVTALANAAKLTVNPNGTLVTGFYDDASRVVAETIGKIDMDIEFAELSQANYAALLGSTYSGGLIQEKSTDTSPWVALGFKAKRVGLDSNSAEIFDYYWLYMGKFSKFSSTYETKKETINLQNVVMKAQFTVPQTDNVWRLRLRTDDSNVPAATITNFFATVVIGSADTTALSVVITEGTAGNAGQLKMVFSKVSAASFNINSATLTTTNVQTVDCTAGNAVLAGSFSTPSAGTSVTVYFTPTTPITAAHVVFATVISGVKDTSGIGCTNAVKYFASWT